MYNPNQVSDMLKIPPSSLRRYVNQYSNHLSNHATKQRIRRFSEADIAILARARELLQQGKKPAEVDNLLSVITSQDDLPDSVLALIPSISQALTEALDTARSLRAEVDIVNTTIKAHDERMSAMADKLAQLESNQNKPWYSKLFKSSTRKPLDK